MPPHKLEAQATGTAATRGSPVALTASTEVAATEVKQIASAN